MNSWNDYSPLKYVDCNTVATVFLFSKIDGFYLNQTLEILNIPWKKTKSVIFEDHESNFVFSSTTKTKTHILDKKTKSPIYLGQKKLKVQSILGKKK